MEKLRRIGFLCVSFLIISCAVHNIPSGPEPNAQVPPNTTIAFVDLNGNFYPDNWEKIIGPYEKTSSLYLTAKKNNVFDILQDFETKKLAEYQNTLKNKERVFIFIHGYNSSADKSKVHYDNLRSKLNINTNTDEIIEFYWDGLSSRDPFGSAKIWFNATGYSQMAGEFGLRKILNVISEKEIILISHSRGASVVLSALSNPPYDPDFLIDTQKLGVPIGNPVPLAERGNRIVSIMLAPAIGEIDFTKENDVNTYRKFSPQLKAIHITINNDDCVLKKFIGLPNNFNTSNLGYNISSYNNLFPIYNFITYDIFTGQKEHGFSNYIDNPQFMEMIKKYI